MQRETDTINKLLNWAKGNDAVRAVALTGSRANPDSNIDIFSDYDIGLLVKDIEPFMNDKWLSFFGEVMICWPLKPGSTFNKNWITRLVLFTNGVRIDFQITSQQSAYISAREEDCKILVDKDDVMKGLIPAHSPGFIVKRPTGEEYRSIVNSFFWNATYVAKNLWRDELYYAKYILDSTLRFNYLQPMIEWYIAMQQDWSISLGKCGRHFKRYLDAKTWSELQATFCDADIQKNWQALFNMIRLFRRLAKEVAKNQGYDYPDEIDRKVTEYSQKVKAA